jgi:Flp pilus assembly protein TadD
VKTHRIMVLLPTLFALGGCATSLSDAQSARSAFAHPSASAPAKSFSGQKETLLYFNVIEGLIKQQRCGAALAFLDDFATSARPLEPRYWLLRGNAALGLGLGRDKDAAAAFAKLEGTPLAAEGWNGGGRVAAEKRDWRGADIEFRKAVAGDPSNPDFLNNLAFVELRLGKRADAAAHLRQAHELAPDSELIRNNLIIALTLTGDSNAANDLLLSIHDDTRRRQVRAAINDAIENNNHFQGGRS